MNIRQSIIKRIKKTETGKQFIKEQRTRIIIFAAFSLFLNLLYAFYNGALGIINNSIWFITMFAYYIILSIMRLSAILCEQKKRHIHSDDVEYFVMRLCGVLFVILSFVLAEVIYISLSWDIATKYNENVMLAIATYTFYKITMTVIKVVKQHKNPSPLLLVIRCIGYAEVAVSVLTLQRSMLVSFGETDNTEIRIRNILVGSAVCLFVLILGITLIIRGIKRKENNHGKI